MDRILEGLDYEWHSIVMKLGSKLAETIVKIGGLNEEVMPQWPLVFQALRKTALRDVKVVLIGQDPYPKDATGLSFSAVKLNPSLRNISKCINRTVLGVPFEPKNGNLECWASQGVLLLNLALTTKVGKIASHTDEWRPFTQALCEQIAIMKNCVWILLGSHAQTIEPNIKKGRPDAHILKWTHPSPQSPINNDINNPRNFIYCNCFKEANNILLESGQEEIDWRFGLDVYPQEYEPEPQLELDVAYVFTDGSSLNNGGKKCRSSWAYRLLRSRNAVDYHEDAGVCELTHTNNVGELTAIAKALLHIDTLADKPKNVVIVSDSKYSIFAISVWYKNWVRDGRLDKMANVPLIESIRAKIEQLREVGVSITFKKVKAHSFEPTANPDTDDYFLKKHNDGVDKLAYGKLRH